VNVLEKCQKNIVFVDVFFQAVNAPKCISDRVPPWTPPEELKTLSPTL